MTQEEQNLIISAFKEDFDKWKEKVISLEKKINEERIDLKQLDENLLNAQIDVEEHNSHKALKKFYYNTVLNRSETLNQDLEFAKLKVKQKENELVDLVMSYQALLLQEPKAVLYDIALYGGNLFKAY